MKPMGEPNRHPNFLKRQVGLIAEDVAAVDPRLAIYEDDGKTPKSYRQEAVIAELIGAVKAQQVEIDELKAQNAALMQASVPSTEFTACMIAGCAVAVPVATVH